VVAYAKDQPGLGDQNSDLLLVTLLQHFGVFSGDGFLYILSHLVKTLNQYVFGFSGHPKRAQKPESDTWIGARGLEKRKVRCLLSTKNIERDPK